MLNSDSHIRALTATGAHFRTLAVLAACASWLVPTIARAEGDAGRVQAAAEFWGELADLDTTLLPVPAIVARGGVNLLIAANKTGAQRYSDSYTSSGKKRRRSLASLIRSRLADDANFRNRTRFLARRIDESGRTTDPPELAFARTGEEFLDALIAASRQGPIANLVIYGHAAAAALFMREDRGFYASVMEVAKSSHVVSGDDDEKEEQLRLAGSRDLSDFEWLLSRGEIRFTRNAVVVFAGCGVAGKRDVEPNSIAARMAEVTGAKVIASIDVTDQSMARGRNFRNHEYSRRSWVRFVGGADTRAAPYARDRRAEAAEFRWRGGGGCVATRN